MCVYIHYILLYIYVYTYIRMNICIHRVYIYIYIYIYTYTCFCANDTVMFGSLWTWFEPLPSGMHMQVLFGQMTSPFVQPFLCAGQSPTNENTLMFHKTILPFGFRDVKVFQQLPKRNTLVTSNPCCCTLRSQVFRILLPFSHSDYWLDKKHWQKKSISLFRGLPLLLSQEHSL